MRCGRRRVSFLVLTACVPLMGACGGDDGAGADAIEGSGDGAADGDSGRNEDIGGDGEADLSAEAEEETGEDATLDADSGAEGDAGDAAEADTGTGDEEWLWRALRGEITPEEALHAVAYSGGWPIRTDDGYLFARLDDGGGPYELAGDHTGWSAVDMTLDHGLWWVRSAVPDPAGSRYKFVDGAGGYGADPMARNFGYDSFGEYSLVAPDGPHLERWPDLGDGVVQPRDLRVWVPAGTPRRHLYVHDGQNLFDPAAPWGGWHLQEALGPETLAVGIDNTTDRLDEYTPVQDEAGGVPIGGRGDEYADFVEETVRPLIETRYGTPEQVGVLGSSLGGLIAFHEATRFPGAYDFAASMSGTFGWGSMELTNETLIDRAAAGGHGTTVLYLDSGGGPGSGCIDLDGDGIQDDSPDAADNYCETRQMADTLAGAGYVWDVDLFHWWEADAPHNEAAWAARVGRPVGIFEGL
ncbi:MAG: alpha/beta hydrolase [Deltaproteobacteria bacterium]|nr:alpha/beta hydrolase [Deltaproteobacteria bacterium]